jgi:hypothetical protein
MNDRGGLVKNRWNLVNCEEADKRDALIPLSAIQRLNGWSLGHSHSELGALTSQGPPLSPALGVYLDHKAVLSNEAPIMHRMPPAPSIHLCGRDGESDDWISNLRALPCGCLTTDGPFQIFYAIGKKLPLGAGMFISSGSSDI